jgi:glycosyltransferase involved in cell wall biosynthesis
MLSSYLPIKRWFGARLLLTLHDYSLVCPNKNFMHNGQVCDGPSLSDCLPCTREHYGATKGMVTTFGDFSYRRAALRLVDKFIAVSRAVAKHNRLSGANYEVIPNFVPDNIAELSDEKFDCLDALPQEPFILFVGDLMHLKGVDILLNAYSTLPTPPPLVLIGRRCPDTPTVLPSNVHVFEPWPHAAIMHAWNRCLFGVLPSVGPEACATVVMEAMAMGKPMVASDIGGMPDLIDGTNGVLVKPDSAVDLANGLRSLIATSGELHAGCLERVKYFKASAVVRRIEAAYDSVSLAAFAAAHG